MVLTGNAMTELISVAEVSDLTTLDQRLKYQWASQNCREAGVFLMKIQHVSGGLNLLSARFSG